MMLFENEQILVFTEDGETKVLSKTGGKVLNISDAVKKIANANGYHKPVIRECNLNAAVIDEVKQKRANELSVWNGLYADSSDLFLKRASSFNPESGACTKVESPYSDLSPNECVDLIKKAKGELELRILERELDNSTYHDLRERHAKAHRESMNLRKLGYSEYFIKFSKKNGMKL